MTASVTDVAVTPIPATLPLFASALGGLGFIGYLIASGTYVAQLLPVAEKGRWLGIYLAFTQISLGLGPTLAEQMIRKRGHDWFFALILLFQVVAARYETGSIVLTTNRAFREWGTLFDVDNTLATALIDRLMHHGEALVIKGDSYRMRDKDKPDDPPSA